MVVVGVKVVEIAVLQVHTLFQIALGKLVPTDIVIEILSVTRNLQEPVQLLSLQ